MQAIFLTGLPRTGTTWAAQALAAATRSRIVHEPFNWQVHPQRRPYHMQYLTGESEQQGFSTILRDSIAPGMLRPLRARGRVVLKDVHCCLAIEKVDAELRPSIVIIARHPCAMAASWSQLGWSIAGRLDLLLDQPALVEAHLARFADHMRSSSDYFFQLGAYWGAVYLVLRRLSAGRPEWQWVTHEELCRRPTASLERLVGRAGLQLASAGRRFLADHDRDVQPDSPYELVRSTSEQADKWRERLDESEKASVLEGAGPFGLLDTLYPERAVPASGER